MSGLSVDDYRNEETLRRRLERGQLFNAVQCHVDTPNPQAQMDETAVEPPVIPNVHVDELDWYISDADPTASKPQTVEEETKRLLALQSYQLVRVLEKQEREYSLDRLSTLARQMFNVSMSFISIIDLGRCLFLALDGIDVREVPRRGTFCSHALISCDDFYEVREAQDHPTLSKLPMVQAGLVSYYACYPLITDEGYRLGCFTIVDDTPRPQGLSANEIQNLKLLADQAMQDLKRHRELCQSRQKLHDMAQTVATLSHDLVTPLSGAQLSLSLLHQTQTETPNLTREQQESLESVRRCTDVMECICDQLREKLGEASSSSSSLEPHHDTKRSATEASIRSSALILNDPSSKRRKRQESAAVPLLSPQEGDALVRDKRNVRGKEKGTALVVEDSACVRKIMARALERLGWNVVQAKNGQVGLSELKQGSFDVCFMDFLMPVMDGFDCCRLFREWEATHRPKHRQRIVGMSAHASPKDVEQSMFLGMDDFAPKPLTVDDLAKLLNDVPEQPCFGNPPRMSIPAYSDTDSKPEQPQDANSDRSCLVIGADPCVATMAHQVEQTPGWVAVVATTPSDGETLLRSRHWSVVLVDNACFCGSGMSGTEFLQNFREWEKQNRIHLQRQIVLCGTALSSILPNHHQPGTHKATLMASLPSGVDGTLAKPVSTSDLAAVLQVSECCRLGEEVITRY